MGKRTPIGKFIHSSWTNLNIRAGKYKHLQTQIKCKSYLNIDISITREEYKKLCYDNKDLILSLKRPSVDRIDPQFGYSLSNINFIELSENIRKDKTVFKGGKGTCYMCKMEKPETDFIIDRRRLNNRSSLCKDCSLIVRRNKYIRSKQKINK